MSENVLRDSSEKPSISSGRISRRYSNSWLNTALVELLSPLGYGAHAAEIGPSAAAYLHQIMKSGAVEDSLRSLNGRYYQMLNEDAPIPFFNGAEDAMILKTMQTNEIQLHGIDQEYFSGIPMLFDMMKLSPCGEALQDEFDLVSSILERSYQRDDRESRFDMCGFLLGNDSIQNLREQLQELDCKEALVIFDSWSISMDIYSRNFRRGGYSHKTRINLLRNQFQKVLESLAVDEKLFLRIGALHTARSHRLGAYDIGNLTQEMGLASVSFTSTSRFFESDGEVRDLWKEQSEMGVLFSFRQLGQKEQWRIVDLKELEKDWRKGKFELANDYSYHLLRQIIEDYDYLLITPLDKEQEILLPRDE
jgi:hypothetical protein